MCISPTEQQNGRENMLENTNLSRRSFLGASSIAAALGLWGFAWGWGVGRMPP